MKARVGVMLIAATWGTPLSGAENFDEAPITPARCALLEESVWLSRSTGVHGAWECLQSTRTIYVATCHEGGSRGSGPVACVAVSLAQDGTPRYNMAECAADPTQAVTVSGPRAFVGSSRGAAMVATAPLNAYCSDESVAALAHFPGE